MVDDLIEKDDPRLAVDEFVVFDVVVSVDAPVGVLPHLLQELLPLQQVVGPDVVEQTPHRLQHPQHHLEQLHLPSSSIQYLLSPISLILPTSLELFSPRQLMQ